MRRKPYGGILTVSIILAALLGTTVYAGDDASCYHVQAMLGRMTVDEGDYLLEETSGSGDRYLLEGDKLDFPVLGASVQKNLWGDRYELGVEGGGIFSWKTNRWSVYISDGGASIKIENSMLLADLFFGGFVASDIGDKVRLYAGAGPLLIYGHQKIDPDYPPIEPYLHYHKSSVSNWDVGVYGRAGIEFGLTEDYSAGIGFRWMETWLELKHPGGKTEIDGLQVLFTLTTTIQ